MSARCLIPRTRLTYRAVICPELGGPDVLRVEPLPEVGLRADEVRIAVHAAGVNFPDLLMVAGKYQFKPPLPFVPGVESAGTIVEAGPAVARFRPGQRVIARQRTGAFAEQVVVPESSIMILPESFTFEEGATFLVSFGTAWHALNTRAQLQKSEHLLVTGAAGGVGLAAVQIGAHLGARVIAAASTAEKREAARLAGAADAIDSGGADFDAQVRERTGGRGADVIYDPVGVPPLALIRAAGFGARVLLIGFTGGGIPEWPANRVLLKGLSVIGVRAGEWGRRFPEQRAEETARLLELAQQGKLRPHVTQRFPLDRAADALRALADRQAIGRIVIVP
jgi:NADPH:quinone reductase